MIAAVCLLLGLSDGTAVVLLDRVVRGLERKAAGDPGMKDASAWESLADACLLRGLAGRGAARGADLARAAALYARLSARLNPRRLDRDALRTLWKHVAALALHDRPALERLFAAMTLRGCAPGWDADDDGRSRWGFRERLEAFRPR